MTSGSKPTNKQESSVPLSEYLRLERELRQAERTFAALVYSMPDARATLWPVNIDVAPDLELTRVDSPTNGSVVFRARKLP